MLYKIQKRNVVGMVEQISKKHRHQVIMSDLGAITSVQQIMIKATMAGTL